jgi:hypothetical protein
MCLLKASIMAVGTTQKVMVGITAAVMDVLIEEDITGTLGRITTMADTSGKEGGGIICRLFYYI